MHTRLMRIAGVLAVLATCAVLQWQARKEAPAPAAVAVQAGAAQPAQFHSVSVPSVPTPAPAPAAPVAAPAVDWRGMHDRMLRAPNLRAFYYEAVQKPQDGGYFYANQALGLCKTVLQAPPEASAAPERRQALAALRERCDLSAQDYEDAWRHFSAIRSLHFDDDPLMRQLFDSLRAGSDDKRFAALRDAVALGNPDVIGSLVSKAVARDVAADPQEEWAARMEREGYAMALVACRLGTDCGADSFQAQVLCIRNGWCASSVEDALRIGLGAGFARLDSQSARAVAAIRQGMLAGLVPARR